MPGPRVSRAIDWSHEEGSCRGARRGRVCSRRLWLERARVRRPSRRARDGRPRHRHGVRHDGRRRQRRPAARDRQPGRQGRDARGHDPALRRARLPHADDARADPAGRVLRQVRRSSTRTRSRTRSPTARSTSPPTRPAISTSSCRRDSSVASARSRSRRARKPSTPRSRASPAKTDAALGDTTPRMLIWPGQWDHIEKSLKKIGVTDFEKFDPGFDLAAYGNKIKTLSTYHIVFLPCSGTVERSGRRRRSGLQRVGRPAAQGRGEGLRRAGRQALRLRLELRVRASGLAWSHLVGRRDEPARLGLPARRRRLRRRSSTTSRSTTG